MDWRSRFPLQKKIAVVGRCPTTAHLAPYADPNWQIWTCGHGARLGDLARWDACFDVHDGTWGAANPHRDWLQAQTKLIVLNRARPEFPGAMALPREELDATFGRFFTSSIAWMLGMAILLAPREIGLWGVEMAAQGEYGPQREACGYLIGFARGRGIRVSLPEQCGLLKAPLYGFQDNVREFS